MRYVLALLLSIPVMAQQPAAAPAAPAADQAAKPADAPAAPADKKEEAKAAESPAPTPAAEQMATGSIDFGYRWRSGVGGSFDSYRSVVNLGEGPKLTGWDLTFQDPKKRFFDRITTQGMDWGGDPYSTARVNATKAGIYDFRFDYRNIAYFNFLPSYADPLMNTQTGFFLNENSFDIRRRMMDIQLDLRPGKRVIPYFDFNRDTGSGHGITTYQSNANEYPVATQYDDSTNTYRGGVRFEMNKWHLTLEQGGVDFGDNQTVTNSQRNIGNLTAPFQGQTLFLGSLLQKYAVSGSAIYSKVMATAHPASWVDLYGQFLYSQPKNDVNYNETASGQFVNLSNLVFYTGQTGILSSAIQQPHTTASAGVELRPLRRLRIIESWTTNRLHDTSGAQSSAELLLNTSTSSNPLSATSAAFAERLVWNYSQEEVNVLYDLFSKLTLRGGYRYVWGDSLVPSPVLNEAGPFEAVQLNQQVGLAGMTFRPIQKLLVNFDFEAASSSHAYFRTSLYNYQKARIRARYQATPILSFNAYFSVLNNENPTPGINYQYLSRDNSLSVIWTPAGAKRISLMADYTRSTLRSDLSYRVPQDGSTAFDHYRDNGHTATSVIDLALPGYSKMTPKLSIGGSMFISSGSRSSSYYQPLARLSIPLMKHLSWNSEWRWYGFAEQFYLYEGFRAHIFMTGLRLAR